MKNKFIYLTTLLLMVPLSLFGYTTAHESGKMMRDYNSTRTPAEWEPHAATWLQWPTKWETSLREDLAVFGKYILRKGGYAARIRYVHWTSDNRGHVGVVIKLGDGRYLTS